jgi:diphthamide biosynthesis protein 7
MDHYKAPVNPCSVESIPNGVVLDSGAKVWPVAVSCYELQEDQSRKGQLDLFLVNENEPLKFGDPHEIQTNTSGILDGKWLQTQRGGGDPSEFWFATARSTGQVRLDAFSFHEPKKDVFQRFTTRHVATSEPLQEEASLCLSVSWDTTKNADDEQQRIVSSYSNGKVAIHDVMKGNEDTIHLIEHQSWLAHTLFGDTPAEVWSACFATDTNNGEIVLSGGDDTKLKLWDVRSTMRPVQVLQHFEAGVTVVSTDPKRSHIVAVGSYDDSMAIYDVRKASTPLCHSESLGGGIWRIKWHPNKSNRLLIAAMHGGCRVVNLAGDEAKLDVEVTKEFTQHESMAYGVDWLASRSDERFEAAASCSFYDRAVYLWETT